jgi:hypothetical protein
MQSGENAMSTVEAGISDDVWSLVQTVERLDNDDQERILRMVSLLTLVTPTVRDNTQLMLRKLLDQDSSTVSECITAVDRVIEYLESSAGQAVADAADQWASLPNYPRRSSRHN